MYTTTLHNQPLTIEFTADKPVLNGEPFDWDLVKLTDRTFHIILQNRSYTAEVLEMNAAEKTVIVVLQLKPGDLIMYQG